MFYLHKTLASWPNNDFPAVLKDELQALDAEVLPLQQGLVHAAYVSDEPFTAIILNTSETDTHVMAKVGFVYRGIISGCSCADDPSPNTETNEYCTVELAINKEDASTMAIIMDDGH